MRRARACLGSQASKISNMRASLGQARRRALGMACLAVVVCLTLMVDAHPAAQSPGTAASALAPSAAAQDANEFIRRVRANLQLDNELQSQYTYLEKRRDVRVSKLG